MTPSEQAFLWMLLAVCVWSLFCMFVGFMAGRASVPRQPERKPEDGREFVRKFYGMSRSR